MLRYDLRPRIIKNHPSFLKEKMLVKKGLREEEAILNWPKLNLYMGHKYICSLVWGVVSTMGFKPTTR